MTYLKASLMYFGSCHSQSAFSLPLKPFPLFKVNKCLKCNKYVEAAESSRSDKRGLGSQPS